MCVCVCACVNLISHQVSMIINDIFSILNFIYESRLFEKFYCLVPLLFHRRRRRRLLLLLLFLLLLLLLGFASHRP